MSRALRYAPPLENRGMVVRPRLLEQLRERFDRPLTAIVAAAGFGKTTLLTQAIEENLLSPLGEDRWLTCQREDTTLSFLAAGAFAAVGAAGPIPDDPRDAAVMVAEAILSAAPTHIALMLDDAHWIPPDSPGAAFIRGLVEELPRNGHVVLASRPPLLLPTSRLVATGAAVVLQETEMQFRPEELATFAETRGVPPEQLSDVSGWPALAELTAMVGPHAVTGFVWEELLSQLSPERRHALGVLVAVGGADDEIAAELLGRRADLDELLDGLPLVVRGASGWRSLHGLWATAMQHRLDAGQVARARRTAGRILARRRQYHDAMDLLLDAEAWDDARALICEVCEVCTPLVPPDVLEIWLRRLPHDVQDTAEGLLLAAMVAEPTRPLVAEQLLERALEDTADAPEVAYACLNALVQLAFWRGDRGQMKALAGRLADLGERGHPEARGWIALLTALLEPSVTAVRAALSSPTLVSGAPLNPVQDWLHAHIVLSKVGDAAAGEVLARRSLAHEVTTMQAVSRAALLESLRMQGDLPGAARLLPDLVADLTHAKILTSPELVTHAVVLCDLIGQHDRAAELLQTFRPTVASSPVAWSQIASVLADAFHQVSIGDEERATTLLRSIAHLGVVRNQAVIQVSTAALPLVYVLLPEVRHVWDDTPPPGCFADVLAAARALVDLREHGATREPQSLGESARELARAALPIPWASELAVGMVASGVAEGRSFLESLGSEARDVLRRQVEGRHRQVASTARRLLRELPAVPSYQLQLCVLGPLELCRDGNPVPSPGLRRERVRQLLGYLISHDRPTRAAITADLWPDLEEAAASSNLRVTLAYLQSALEPDRGDQDPPYFVRSSGSVLHLVDNESLRVDVRRFERFLDEASRLEKQGVPSRALDAYVRGLDEWHGDYLADVASDAPWLVWERDRLRSRFVTSAVRAGNLSLARGDLDSARAMAERAVLVDPWSETAYELLVSAHLASGNRVDAHRALRRCKEMLRELGVSPRERTVALARQLQVQLQH